MSQPPIPGGDEDVCEKGEYAHKHGYVQKEDDKRMASDKAYGAVPFAVKLWQQGLAGAIEEGTCGGSPEKVGKVSHYGEHVAGRDFALVVEQARISPKIFRREEESEVYGRRFGRSVAEVKYEGYCAKSHAAYRDRALVPAAEKVYERV